MDDYFLGIGIPSQPKPQPPDHYDDVDQAIQAVILHAGSNFYSQDELNAPAAASAIVEAAESLVLSGERFVSLEWASQRINGYEPRKAILDVLLKWGSDHWDLVGSLLKEHAISLFTKEKHYSVNDDFCTFIKRWQRLQDDPELLEVLLGKVRNETPNFNVWVPRLCKLNGHRSGAMQILSAVMTQLGSFKSREELSSLFARWSGDTRWGQLQHLLWGGGIGNDSESGLSLALDGPVTLVAELLREFGLSTYPTSSYAVTQLGCETKASWRRQLDAVIEGDTALREATLEALLWYGPLNQDRAIVFTALELHGDRCEAALSSLLNHTDRLVRRRACAVRDMAHQAPDLMALNMSQRNEAISARPAATTARTWIDNAEFEQLIERTLNESANRSAAWIYKTLSSGEEVHLTLMFERLATAFSNITEQLAIIADETDANERLELKLVHRIVGKQEEGGPGLGSDSFSADVCLIFEGRESGKTFARRASLLQAKRLYLTSGGREYYPIKNSQLHDLTSQTMASFLLLLGPECQGVSIPVIPARLIEDLIERGESATQIAPDKAALLGKGIGTWLIEDVIGLWTGDWNEALLKRAQGGKHSEPYLLFELIVDRVRKVNDHGDR
ncbi:hypothetical protein BLL37_16465 [Pseudomonas azotoformans]|uniref:Uncharacterized protein n=1 Tax=Pseudomonas azotoformans TaxID=47878 RepID=A0A1V2JHU8_PSEAZ|nr:hypothetical protein [Pseudomonas azotoformans]OIN46458.1 hypothetical protein BFL39_22425 [Pseudomonas azotoformans]ONH44914.1 hypothetical protein BLL37_16465 [Pseudomonas azotoformans]SDN09850.1 hypothetical protein SAMN04489799_1069 [Pseudomonas azotoformans]